MLSDGFAAFVLDIEPQLTESGLANAEAKTTSLFGDSGGPSGGGVLEAFQGDPRLHFVDEEELFSVPVIKLAAKYGLTASASESSIPSGVSEDD